ncbi:MAG: S8 family serine peptidase [Chitinivibrionales bacterium]|nr:S8 family serine peptidase [Chitinivibrionales bacterium]
MSVEAGQANGSLPFLMNRYPRMKSILLIVFCAASASPLRAGVSPVLRKAAQQDTVCRIWVVFRDKPLLKAHLSPASLKRRLSRGKHIDARADSPLNPFYIKTISGLGAQLQQKSAWGNAASFTLQSSLILQIADLDFVQAVVPVKQWRRPAPIAEPRRKSIARPGYFGATTRQLDIVSASRAHDYFHDSLKSIPGEGIIIAVFDNGFRLDHTCLAYVKERNAIIGDSDFVHNDGDPAVTNMHGLQTLSQIAAFSPDTFVGVAYGAQFLLARTEIDSVELHIEEDNYIAALEWAERQGADIVSSSLGYRFGFDTPDTNYTFEDMNGHNVTMSRLAAEYALQRGVQIVTAAGNEGDLNIADPTIVAPGDATGVITVGSVDGDLHISSFSSRGPTADGRIKPEVVAMGEMVPVPNPETGSYLYSSGTSFSTPMVAGVIALIMQTHPGEPLELIRSYLLASCDYAPLQDSVDNVYGYGIPHALRACRMSRSSISFHVRNCLNAAVSGAVIVSKQGAVLAETNADGYAQIQARDVGLPLAANVIFEPSQDTVPVWADTAPHWFSIDIAGTMRIVRIIDTDNPTSSAVPDARIIWRLMSSAYADTVTGDSSGFAQLCAPAGSYRFEVSAAGYFPWEHDNVVISHQSDTLVINLKAHLKPILYPNVVRRSAADSRILVAFTPNTEVLVTLTIRNVSGELVWEHNELAAERVRFAVEWDLTTATGRRIAPGTYYCIMRIGDRNFIKKLLILG